MHPLTNEIETKLILLPFDWIIRFDSMLRFCAADNCAADNC